MRGEERRREKGLCRAEGERELLARSKLVILSDIFWDALTSTNVRCVGGALASLSDSSPLALLDWSLFWGKPPASKDPRNERKFCKIVETQACGHDSLRTTLLFAVPVSLQQPACACTAQQLYRCRLEPLGSFDSSSSCVIP